MQAAQAISPCDSGVVTQEGMCAEEGEEWAG